MTVEALRGAGADVDDDEPGRWVVQPGGLTAGDLVVEPDPSTAAAYLAAPLVAGDSVTVPGWPRGTAQSGSVQPELLEAMGARVTWSDDAITVTGDDGVHGLDADVRDAPELAPVLAALAALAGFPSRLSGVAHIRLQETDRLAALATELGRVGADARETDDGLEVRSASGLTGATLPSYDDHRIAMAWAVLGLGVEGVVVEDVATTRKTVPDFLGSWTATLAGA